MKKLMMALVVAATGTLMMSAQPPQGCPQGRPQQGKDFNPEAMVQMRVDRLDKAVNLTDAQKQQATQIYQEEMEAMKKDAPQCDKKDKKGPKPGGPKGGPKKELTAEQKAQFDEMQAKQKAQRDATDAKIEAILTADQKAKYSEFKNQPPMPGKPDNRGGGCCCCCHGGQGGQGGPGMPPPPQDGQKCPQQQTNN